MHRSLMLGVLTATLQTLALSQEQRVELDYRLQPGRDLTATVSNEAITTMRVIEDRGLIEKSNGRLTREGATVHLSTRQTLRYITGERTAGGSFAVEMRFVDKSTTIKGVDDQEQTLPEKKGTKGMNVTAMAMSHSLLNRAG
jgi:hypothetical protein